VQRNRYFLHGYLTLYIILVTIVFPLLFINAENGAIQDKIEQAAEVDMDEENRQFLSYSDGLYWSVITASSIGYGDVTPVTQVGRIIAATLGIMGVITVAVIAGLILEWITPRRLDKFQATYNRVFWQLKRPFSFPKGVSKLRA
jgi:voltage-gated potassium channel Kch